jgi:flagellar FliJ protein
MSAISSILVAEEIAEARRDAVVQHLANAERVLQHAEDQLKQLEDYVLETDGRMVQSGRAFQSMEVVRHQHQFMARLQHAIGLQTDAVANSRRQRDAVRAVLVEAEGKLAMLRKLLALRNAELARKEARREQAAMDEMAQGMHARKRNGSLQGEKSWR